MRHVALLLLVPALGACGAINLREPEPLPPESPTAAPVGLRVDGVVTDRWGYRVPDAWVTVRVGSPQQDLRGDDDCRDASHLPTRTRTTPMGEFSVVVDAGHRASFHACVEVEALPPAGTDLRESAVAVPSAPFTAAGAAGSGDVLRVHVVLY